MVRKRLRSEQKEREREVLPLSNALTALCEKRFGFALKLGGEPLLHLFGVGSILPSIIPVMISSIRYAGMSRK